VTTIQGALMVLGAARALAGLAPLILLRTGRAVPLRLAGVGRISIVAQAVTGLALIGVGYHVFVHAAGLAQFRAPLPIAVGVAIVAILGSVLVDAVENRALAPEDGQEEDDGEPSDRSGR